MGNGVWQLTLFLTQVTHIKTIHQEDELIEIQSDTGTWYQRWGVRALSLGGQVMGDGGRRTWPCDGESELTKNGVCEMRWQCGHPRRSLCPL